MARIGYLFLREGKWNGEEILPASFIRAVREPDPALAKLPVRDPVNYGHASSHYSLLWWNNADGTIKGLPRDAHWSWGLYDSLIAVIPSLDMVLARAGPAKSWKRETGADHYDVLKPFLEPIAASVKSKSADVHGPRASHTLAPSGGEGQGEGAGVTPSAPYLHSPVIKEIHWAPTNTIIRRARGS